MLTTRDDETNVYLAIYCRQLRPDIQIIARANSERSVPTLHRAGTDFVMSYPSMGAREIANLLKRSSTLMIAEGLEVVRLPVPDSLAGKSIAASGIRPRTGCSVVATSLNGSTSVNPDPGKVLPAGGRDDPDRDRRRGAKVPQGIPGRLTVRIVPETLPNLGRLFGGDLFQLAQHARATSTWGGLTLLRTTRCMAIRPHWSPCRQGRQLPRIRVRRS